MILFFGDGRLGNQIFQYVFLKSIETKSQLIVTYNFDEILQLFDSIKNVINIRNRYLRYLIRNFLVPTLDFLAKKKLISSYQVDRYDEKGLSVPDVTYTKVNGRLPITYIYSCFAQSELFFKQEIAHKLTINEVHLKKADEFLSTIPNNFKKIFVHIRRSDYLDFIVFGKSVSLPISYYNLCISRYRQGLENPFFIFLTDDPVFVENNFFGIANKVISKNDLFVDFAIITKCEYGIMSNSSFSWWAAYLMSDRKQVYAPKYWLGWQSRVEYHKGTTPSFAEKIEIIE